MSQRNKLSPADIPLPLIDAEISESVMGEPDLLVLFGPYVTLQGYPPWQVRLTEIFHVQDSDYATPDDPTAASSHRIHTPSMRAFTYVHPSPIQHARYVRILQLLH
ncbi:MAG: hypothetical protein LQ347_003441 [Umbilicaria vellea]|nr:MAG: hypothetical protein LQ347_003441 [Umbilicaria vellea]